MVDAFVYLHSVTVSSKQAVPAIESNWAQSGFCAMSGRWESHSYTLHVRMFARLRTSSHIMLNIGHRSTSCPAVAATQTCLVPHTVGRLLTKVWI